MMKIYVRKPKRVLRRSGSGARNAKPKPPRRGWVRSLLLMESRMNGFLPFSFCVSFTFPDVPPLQSPPVFSVFHLLPGVVLADVGLLPFHPILFIGLCLIPLNVLYLISFHARCSSSVPRRPLIFPFIALSSLFWVPSHSFAESACHLFLCSSSHCFFRKKERFVDLFSRIFLFERPLSRTLHFP